MTKKLIKVNNLSSSQYSVNQNITLKTSMLRSDLRDYSDAYIAVKETITVEKDDHHRKRDKKASSKNNTP